MVSVFDKHVQRYESWFNRHSAAYMMEVEAVRSSLPPEGKGMEVGVGTGNGRHD